MPGCVLGTEEAEGGGREQGMIHAFELGREGRPRLGQSPDSKIRVMF